MAVVLQSLCYPYNQRYRVYLKRKTDRRYRCRPSGETNKKLNFGILSLQSTIMKKGTRYCSHIRRLATGTVINNEASGMADECHVCVYVCVTYS